MWPSLPITQRWNATLTVLTWLLLVKEMEREQRGVWLGQQVELQMELPPLEGGSQPASSPALPPPWGQWECPVAHCDCLPPSVKRVREAFAQWDRFRSHFRSRSGTARIKLKVFCWNILKKENLQKISEGEVILKFISYPAGTEQTDILTTVIWAPL